MNSPSRQLDAVAEEEDQGGPARITSSASAPRQEAHARKHSRIHERNLSAFFPRPGQRGEGYGGTYDDPHAAPFQAGVADMQSSPSGRARRPESPETPSKPQAGRRGHHHRHSVSHNLFPFLDPTGSASPSSSPTKTFTPSKSAESQLPATSASFRQRYAHHGLFVQILAFAFFVVPPTTRALLFLSAAQIAVGATLWVQGQSGESLAVTGLGYLVVFDGIGGLSSGLLERRVQGQAVWEVVGSSRDGSVRQPYGCFRLVTLSHFSQAVYLLFSAVYVCKESVEHVLLLHDPQDADASHGKGHGGVGHGEGRSVAVDVHDAGASVPRLALLSAVILALILAIALGNHRGLSSSGRSSSSVDGHRSRSLGGASEPFFRRVMNPFTAAVVLFGLALVAMSTVLPPAQFGPVDKVFALLESIAMFCIALPAAGTTGQILLQTSPLPRSAPLRAMEAAINEIEQHPFCDGIEARHAWELASIDTSTSSLQVPQTVVTLSILAKHDASDGDLLGMTRMVHERTASALSGSRVGVDSEVDLVVAVKRA
ncbi:hypothetical protein JCM6882_006885 [Rhodosporidiobolus microsporus]